MKGNDKNIVAAAIIAAGLFYLGRQIGRIAREAEDTGAVVDRVAESPLLRALTSVGG